MSDSRDLHASAGVDNHAGLRNSAPGEPRSSSAAGDKVSAGAGAEQPTPSRKFRVRIDPAHAIGDAPPPVANVAADEIAPATADEGRDAVRDSKGSSSGEVASDEAASILTDADALSEIFSVEKLQQLRLQFEQLAGHLRSQQYQLDRREAQLHSQLAQQENEFRASRLWFREHQQDLADREADLERRQLETEAATNERLNEREAELSRREEELESQRAGLVENLSVREAELARREVEFDSRAAQSVNDHARWTDDQARREAECRDIKRQWQEQADALAERHRELEQLRESLLRQSDATAIADAVRIASEQAAAENAVIEIAAERAAEIAAERSEVQTRLAEQLQADAEQFYTQIGSTLDLMRQFLAGQVPKAGELNRAPLDFFPSEPGKPGLPPEMLELFGEFRAALAKLYGRQKNLEEAEALLTDGQGALDRGRQQLTADRQAWQQRCDIERRRISDDRRQAEADLNKKLQTLSLRGEHLERRTVAVDQLRAEVLRTQRETLELRLATDEIWVQLSGSVPPPVLTQSLARIRSKLAEQYQLERAELADQQKQLEALAVRLEAQHDKLHQQRQALEQWVADRRNEIEGQASRLVAQEMELGRRQSELEEMNERQQSERRLYEGEIRRLLGELRNGGTAATLAAA